MRKFVIKNRQKRKYTKKSGEISSFSFSKTLYNMLPLLVMLVAFMSTVVISTPFRDSLSNIRFIIQLPEFSLSNPLASWQAFILTLTQFGILLWTTLLAFFTAVQQIIKNFSEMIGHISISLDPRPLLFFINNELLHMGNILTSAIVFVGQGITSIAYALLQSLIIIREWVVGGSITVGSWVIHLGNVVIQAMLAGTISIVTMIFISTMLIVHTLFIAIVFIGQTLSIFGLTIFHVLALTLQTIVAIITSITTAIGAAIASAFRALVHLIELPFKILYAYWLQLKPYVVILGQHLQMAGADLSNVFKDGGKIISLLSSSK